MSLIELRSVTRRYPGVLALEDRGDALLSRGPRIMFSLRPYVIATMMLEGNE